MKKNFNPARRSLILSASATAALGALGATPAFARSKEIKIGYVSPQTGPLAPFGESDKWVIASLQDMFKAGIEVGGKKLPVKVLLKDSQSSPNRAGEVANDLILRDNVDMILVSSTPETANPVSDACELNEVPCISTVVPWQSWFFGRKGNPDKGFNWTYHFFWGLDEALNTFVGLWNGLETNKKVGMLFPQNIDGETWGNDSYGLPVPTKKAGYEVFVPGYFQPRTNDFSAQIAEFKKNNCEIIGGITYPDDLKTFVTQCNQQGFKPKAVTVAAALLFPSSVEAMGPLGNGMSSEVWWTPAFPFKSSLTGQVSQDIATQWEADTKRQWTQPLGYSHALLEVAIDILKRSSNPLDREANRDAMAATNLQSLVGPIKFDGTPHKNICKTPIFGGQWVKGEKWPYDLKIVDNSVNQLFQPQQKIQPIQWP